MSNIVKMDKALPALPDYLKGLSKAGSNDEVRDGLTSGVIVPPRISIEGKVFRVVQDGVSRPLVRVNDDGVEEAVQSLNVVVLRANRGKYKLFYGSKYDPDAEATSPLCYSYDGVAPSLFADDPQAQTCATCEHNRWGSEITEQGKKSRACSDNKLLAVIPLAAVNKQAASNTVEGQVYAIKVSPTALSRSREDRNKEPQNNTSLQEYVQLLDAYPTTEGNAEVPISNVATRLFFEIKSQYPLLRFKLARFLTVEEIEYVASRLDGEDVQRIIADQGQGPSPTRAALPAATKPEVLTGPPKTEVVEPAKEEEEEVEFVPVPAVVRRGRPPNKPLEPEPVKTGKRERVKPEKTPANVDEEIAKLGSLFD